MDLCQSLCQRALKFWRTLFFFSLNFTQHSKMFCSEGDSDCEKFDDDDPILLSMPLENGRVDEWDDELTSDFFRNPSYLAMENQLLSLSGGLRESVMLEEKDASIRNAKGTDEAIHALLEDIIEKVCSTSITEDDKTKDSSIGRIDSGVKLDGFDVVSPRTGTDEFLFDAVDRFIQDVYEWNALDNFDTLDSMMSVHGYVFLKVSQLLFNRKILAASEQASMMAMPMKKVPQVLIDTFVALHTEGDGSCFFNSISLALFGSPDFTDVIRAGAIISVRKHFARVEQLKFNMAIPTLKSLAISVNVRKRNGLKFEDSFNTLLCPVLVSAAINSPVVIIRQFNRTILNLFHSLDNQDVKLKEMITNGFQGIMMFAASCKIETSDHLTLLFENGNHFSCLAKKETSPNSYIPPYAFAAATTLY